MFEEFKYLNDPMKNLILGESIDIEIDRSAKANRDHVIKLLGSDRGVPTTDGFRFFLDELVKEGIAYRVDPKTRKQYGARSYCLIDVRYAKAAKIVNKWSARKKTDITKVVGVPILKKGSKKTNLENRIDIITQLHDYGEHSTSDLVTILDIKRRTLCKNLAGLHEIGMIERPSNANSTSFNKNILNYFLDNLPSAISNTFALCKTRDQFTVLDTLPEEFSKSQKDFASKKLKDMEQFGLITSTGKRNKIYQPCVSPKEFREKQSYYISQLVNHFYQFAPLQLDFFNAIDSGDLPQKVLKNCTLSDIKNVIKHNHSAIKYVVDKMIRKSYAKKINDITKRGHSVHVSSEKCESFVEECMKPVEKLFNKKTANIPSGIVRNYRFVPEIDYTLTEPQINELRLQFYRRTKKT